MEGAKPKSTWASCFNSAALEPAAPTVISDSVSIPRMPYLELVIASLLPSVVPKCFLVGKGITETETSTSLDGAQK